MLAGEDPADAGFLGGRAEARERPRHAGQRRRAQCEALRVAVEAREHVCTGGADRAVRSGIGRIGGRVPRERQPRRVGDGVDVAVGVGETDRGHRPPEAVRVLRVVEGDRRVGEAQVQRREQASRRRQVAVVRSGDRLRDLVPEVLDRRVPELSDLGLLGGAGRACRRPDRLHFVERVRVLLALQRRRLLRPELVAALEHEWRHLAPRRERRRREVRRRRPVVAGTVTRDERRRRDARAVARANREQVCRDGVAETDPLLLRRPIRYRSELGRIGRVDRRLLRRVERE